MANFEIQPIKPIENTDISQALLSAAMTGGPLKQLGLLRESAGISDKTLSQFPAASDLLPKDADQSISKTGDGSSNHPGEPHNGHGDDDKTTGEWPANPAPSAVFLGHIRNRANAAQLFPGMDEASVQRNQLAQRYLNSKEHLGDEPLTKEEEAILFNDPSVKGKLDHMIQHDRPTPRFN